MRGEHSGLTLKPKHRAVHIWLSGKNTDVVGKIARGEIVRAVDDHVVLSYDSLRVLAGQSTLVQFDVYVWVDVLQPVARRFKFAAADVFCSVKDLPLQIGKIDTVEIDQPKFSHTCCCQIERRRGAEPAGAD